MATQVGFLYMPDRCIDCWACQVACKQWHGIKAGTYARRRLEETFEGTFPQVTRSFLSKACMHCDEPACVEVCPAGALYKREEDGAVLVDQELCIACGSCGQACPYDVPQYDESKGGKMDKCDHCISLAVGASEETRCAATCVTEALMSGTVDELQAKAKEMGLTVERFDGPTAPNLFIAK